MSNLSSYIKSIVSTRTFNQLSNDEKDIIIDHVIDCPDLIKHKDIMSRCESQIEDRLENEASMIKKELDEKYGINARIYYSVNLDQNDGFYFESITLFAHYHLLKSLNYENLFDNKDEEYQKVLKSYIEQMSMSTSLSNLSLRPEYRMGVNVENYNNDVENLLIENLDEDELNSENEKSKKYREWYTLLDKKLNPKVVEEFLKEWVVEYCLESYNRLRLVSNIKPEEHRKMIAEIIENAYWYTNHGDCNNEEVKEYRFIFENQDDDINMIDING